MPNKDFAQAARGHWFALKETGKDISKLLSFLSMEKAVLVSQIGSLLGAVEEGVVEYKRGAAGRIFALLTECRFRSLEARELREAEEGAGCLIFAVWVQKLISEGKIVLREGRTERGESEEGPEAGEILAEIDDRITADPAAARHPAVKNILLQKEKYEKEMESLKKLTQSVPKEKAREIALNFHRTFADIFGSIKKNYTALIREEEEARKPEPADPLIRCNLQPLTAVFTRQAEAASQLRAALIFSRAGGGVREVLVAASEKQKTFRDLLKEEMQQYLNLSGDRKTALQMSASFAREVVRMINLWKDDLF